MHYNLSKMARIIIIINIILALMMAGYSGVKMVKIGETTKIISNYMDEYDVERDDAIFMLEQEGVELYLGDEFFALFGMVMPVFSIALLILFAMKNSFLIGFMAAMVCVFTTFIGGFLLFYVLLSNKSQTKGKEIEYTYKDDWTHYIHNKNVTD